MNYVVLTVLCVWGSLLLIIYLLYFIQRVWIYGRGPER